MGRSAHANQGSRMVQRAGLQAFCRFTMCLAAVSLAFMAGGSGAAPPGPCMPGTDGRAASEFCLAVSYALETSTAAAPHAGSDRCAVTNCVTQPWRSCTMGAAAWGGDAAPAGPAARGYLYHTTSLHKLCGKLFNTLPPTLLQPHRRGHGRRCRPGCG